MKILHISDIHFGRHYFVDRGLTSTSRLASIIAGDRTIAGADLIAVTGDLTWSSTQEEFDDALRFVRALTEALPAAQLIVVPGNHDTDLSDVIATTAGRKAIPLPTDSRQDRFLEFINRVYGPRVDEVFPLLNSNSGLPRRQRLVPVVLGNDFMALGINSAALLGTVPGSSAISTPIGVTPAVFEALDHLAALNNAPPEVIRIFLLHHHLFPFADPDWGNTIDTTLVGTTPDSTIVADSGHLQGWLADNGFQVVLHGHKHVPHGRVDQLWTRGPSSSQRQVLVVGAGSSGVDASHRPDAEPLTYNVIDAEKTKDGRVFARVSVRRIDFSGGRHRSSEHFSFDATCGRSVARQVAHVFHGNDAAECHRAVRRELEDVRLVYNFLSVVDVAEYVHPVDTVEFKGMSVPIDFIRDAYRALQPTLGFGDSAGSYREGRRRTADGREMRYRLEHGPRIFSSQIGDASGSPYAAALTALTTSEGGRRSYIGLYVTERDAIRLASQPPPGLVGIQFHHEDPGGVNRLHIAATFRHLELSFWWAVNMYEMGELLRRAVNDVPAAERAPQPGSITLFAALAGWETDPSAVATAELDVLSTQAMIEMVADAMLEMEEGSHGVGISHLKDVLAQKAQYLNVSNIETVGLAQLAGVIGGLLRPLKLGVARRYWAAVQGHLLSAIESLDKAVQDSGSRADGVARGVASIRSAASVLAGMS